MSILRKALRTIHRVLGLQALKELWERSYLMSNPLATAHFGSVCDELKVVGIADIEDELIEEQSN